ncbi:glycosyltransferase family 4 protein [Herbiconiux sp.]|uniref:glycosyltransferase family 4 protein n=1 Tax=Herbiconiux sp. TaxID=1871186 RepID=UPI0025C638A8|nr:glycosyltransferase family 4 protein [Herbiconiux sp.]
MNFPPEPTGNAPYTGALARGLAERGFPVTALTAHPHYPEWKIRDGYGQWRRRDIRDGVRVVRLRHFVPKKLTSLRRLLSELSFGVRAVCEHWAADVVLFVSPALFATAVATIKRRLLRRHVSSIVWVQDIYSLGITETGTGSASVARRIGTVERYALGSADAVVVIHDRFRTYLIDHLNVDSKKIVVIRNWTHLKRAPVIDRARVRGEMGWADDQVVVLHAGNMGVKQGLENVIEAAKYADKKRSNVRFVLMGDGNQRTHLEELARGVERIEFLPPLSEARFQEALGAADILLVNEQANLSEMSVPSKLTSYFNAAKPVLASTDAASVTAEELSRSGGGIRVDPDQPAALHDAAQRLGDDEEERYRLGARGLEFRNSALDESTAFDQYAELVRSLAAKRGR